VNPNVVNRTTQSGGVAIPTNLGALYKPISNSELVKVCPFCGNQVFSEQDVIAKEKADEAVGMFWFIFLVGFAVLILIAFLATKS
jgi:hypothetical protein